MQNHLGTTPDKQHKVLYRVNYNKFHLPTLSNTNQLNGGPWATVIVHTCKYMHH